jgi:coenzyme F420 biosynthesis associated uncharacterized protein
MARSRRPSIRRSVAVAVGTGVAAAAVRALARPRGPAGKRSGSGPHRLMDWDAVRRAARARTGERGRLDAERAARLAATYDAYAAELAPAMAQVCGSLPEPFPPFRVLDRRGFIDANLEIVRRLVEPVERLRASLPESALGALGRRLTSRYVGELLGIMSQRVLGQFDPVLTLPEPAVTERPPRALYLVEPNVESFERDHGVPGEALRRWLILHEATHAWQFEAHPWLAPHIGELMNELVVTGLTAELERSARSGVDLEALRRLGVALTGQLRGIGRLQALMSVIEGYSNFVMHRAGRREIAEYEELERAFERRQTERSLLERLVLALSGVAVKLRQYQLGERFCDAVAAQGGVELLNRVWEGPETMPSLSELRAPARWVARVTASG